MATRPSDSWVPKGTRRQGIPCGQVGCDGISTAPSVASRSLGTSRDIELDCIRYTVHEADVCLYMRVYMRVYMHRSSTLQAYMGLTKCTMLDEGSMLGRLVARECRRQYGVETTF
ncbi:l-carnitine dehydratase bile acid-inducible protein f [Lasius niger]|uniref:L-carnitine dehydratase bile acid-inducible protein f n=1 Tax=Lasius niger TaxID=67767 RepID=A0A0J7MNK7_LASNI|nr:l-carnitine dehydratase bile acid-inducible protein f [Lasius niger]